MEPWECVCEDFLWSFGTGISSYRQPQESVIKAPMAEATVGERRAPDHKKAWLWAVALLHLDMSLDIFKSVSFVERSQLCLSAQGYYKDCVSRRMYKYFDYCKPLSCWACLTYAIIGRAQIGNGHADSHPPGTPRACLFFGDSYTRHTSR